MQLRSDSSTTAAILTLNPHCETLAALLKACRTRPDEDAPRLILADWLDERGEAARAECIRLDVQRHQYGGHALLRDRTLDQRIEALLSAHAVEWIGPIAGVDEVAEWRRHGVLTFDRGLIAVRYGEEFYETSLRLNEWLCGPWGHWLGEVRLTYTDDLAPFVQAQLPPELAGRIRLHYAEMGRANNNRSLERLAFSANYGLLQSLHVQSPVASGDVLLRNLTRVDNTHLLELRCPTASVLAAELIVAGEYTHLRTLAIGTLTASSVAVLARAPSLPNLARLPLDGCPIGDSGMEALCDSPLAEHFLGTGFANMRFANRGAIALARSPILKNLAGPKLNLMMNQIGDVGLAAIAESPALLRFSELVLRENQIGDGGLIALAESPYAVNLRWLDLWRNRIGDRGAQALARSPYLRGLIDLSVKENRLTDTGAAALTARFGPIAKL